MITIMGQMDRASRIFDYMYLGTEWNASNLEELESNKFDCRIHLPAHARSPPAQPNPSSSSSLAFVLVAAADMCST